MTQVLSKISETSRIEALKLVIGVIALTTLAQIKFYLPLSPVPVTGQTFGVALLALTYGRKLGAATILSYISLGSLGLPIFAGFSAGLIGPSFGYLIGMILSAYVIGGLSDKGAKSSFSKALFSTYMGSICVFTCGAIGLSFFLPLRDVFLLGVFPFLAGDLVKNLAAATISTKILNK